MLDQAFKKTAVIGAAGKMGRGIALLLLQEIGRTAAEGQNFSDYHLRLIDTSESALDDLRHYLKIQLTKFA